VRHDDEDSSLLPSPLAQLVSQRTVDRELNDELAAHLEMHTRGQSARWHGAGERTSRRAAEAWRRGANERVVSRTPQQQGSHSLFQPGDAPRIALMAAPDVVVGMRDRFSTTLTILVSAVCIVLLIACANVAGLMLHTRNVYV
jgi:hypothetical protein